MKANKDKGTSVGKSNRIEKDLFVDFPVNKVCEHEWVTQTMTITNGLTSMTILCKNCGLINPDVGLSAGTIKPIDFKISENLSQINKQQWEDIWKEFCFSPTKQNIKVEEFLPEFWKWLKEHYNAPEKK